MLLVNCESKLEGLSSNLLSHTHSCFQVTSYYNRKTRENRDHVVGPKGSEGELVMISKFPTLPPGLARYCCSTVALFVHRLSGGCVCTIYHKNDVDVISFHCNYTPITVPQDNTHANRYTMSPVYT